MKLQIFQVDAFADRVFTGNPAAIVPLTEWISNDLMLAIAAENNLSETAFFIPDGDGYQLRWYTPAVEVDLCGHATLAAAHVLFTHLGHTGKEIQFATQSGTLTVKQEAGALLAMDFPSRHGHEIPVPDSLSIALRDAPISTLGSKPMLTVFDSADDVVAITPNFEKLKVFCEERGGIGIIATANAPEGSGWDFVSRLFSPAKGINEDPVTGAAHTVLVPYWAKRLNKNELVARQISSRGGTLWCTNTADRVIIRGHCTDYLKGEIEI